MRYIALKIVPYFVEELLSVFKTLSCISVKLGVGGVVVCVFRSVIGEGLYEGMCAL